MYSLSNSQMLEVLDHCKAVDVDAFCTPWDLPSLRVLADYGVPALKIASADLTNHVLLRACADEHVPLLVSTGMSTEDEIVASVAVLRQAGAQFALLQCQSTYPAPFKDVNLRYMDRLAEIGDCPVGYSGHERGFHVALAAVARGAHIIESTSPPTRRSRATTTRCRCCRASSSRWWRALARWRPRWAATRPAQSPPAR